jgi:hypothetical protein
MATLAGDRHLPPDRGAGGEGQGTTTSWAETRQGDQGETLAQLPNPQEPSDGKGSYGPGYMRRHHAHHRSAHQTPGEESPPPEPPPCDAPWKDVQLSGGGLEAEKRDGSGKGQRGGDPTVALIHLIHCSGADSGNYCRKSKEPFRNHREHEDLEYSPTPWLVPAGDRSLNMEGEYIYVFTVSQFPEAAMRLRTGPKQPT